MKIKTSIICFFFFVSGIIYSQSNPGQVFTIEWIYPSYPDTSENAVDTGNVKSCTYLPPDSVRTFGNIRSMKCDKENNLYVWDAGYQALWKFNPEGKKVWRKKYPEGKNEGEFLNTGMAFAVSENGKVCIGDKNNRTLTVLDKDGIFETRFPVKMIPATITFGKDESIYLNGFLSYKGNVIHHYSAAGEFLDSFCEKKDTSHAILFSGDCGHLITDAEGNILYSHLYRYKIDKFSKDGILLDSFGENMDELLIPGIKGITMLGKDYLAAFVFGDDDESKWRVDFYNKSKKISSFPSNAILSPKFRYRCSTADSDGNIYFDISRYSEPVVAKYKVNFEEIK